MLPQIKILIQIFCNIKLHDGVTRCCRDGDQQLIPISVSGKALFMT